MEQIFLLKNNTGIIKLSHMSVKDYLLSHHCVGATGFGLTEKFSHSLIAKTCLAYLLQFENLDMLNLDAIDKYPLAQYAAEYWIMHVRHGVNNGTDFQQENLIMTFFRPWHTAPFISWVRIHDIDDRDDILQISETTSDIPSTIYYASSAGLLLAVKALVMNGVDVNAQGGFYGNALQAASYKGHEAIVGLLLENGADVNAQGGKYGNALQAASCRGHEAIVCLLLEKGTDVNAQGGDYGNALQTASY